MNLTILGLGLAVMGVSIGEGILVANIAKAAARQPEMFSKTSNIDVYWCCLHRRYFLRICFALSYIV